MVADNVKTKFEPVRSLGCAAVVAASVALCSCTPKTPGPTSLPSTQSDPNAALSMALERTQLKNGLRVTVLPRPSSRTAAAELYIPALGDYGDWPNQIMRIDVERCRRAAERYLSKAFPSIVVTGVDESFAP